MQRNADNESAPHEKMCSACASSTVNGVFVHEEGCPNTPGECLSCGCEMEGGHGLCGEHCSADYYNRPCECSFCRKDEEVSLMKKEKELTKLDRLLIVEAALVAAEGYVPSHLTDALVGWLEDQWRGMQ
jgi:hypothetical protein